MYTIVTQYADKPVTAYQISDIDSAMYVARTTAQYDGVLQTTIFEPNARDHNGLGSMTFIATFGHNAPAN